eukprot:7386958-Ditylum_brightwellii.AAC.1
MADFRARTDCNRVKLSKQMCLLRVRVLQAITLCRRECCCLKKTPTSTVSEQLCCLELTFGLAAQNGRKGGTVCSTNIVKSTRNLPQ